jgi:hypothetical protein
LLGCISLPNFVAGLASGGAAAWLEEGGIFDSALMAFAIRALLACSAACLRSRFSFADDFLTGTAAAVEDEAVAVHVRSKLTAIS